MPLSEPQFGFITGLSESRLIRTTSTLHAWNGRDIADFTFLMFLTLEILRNETSSKPQALEYAGQTMKYGNFTRFFQGTNDLYVLLHMFLGEHREKTWESLADHKTSAAFLKTTKLSYLMVRDYLRYLHTDQLSDVRVRQFFLAIEGQLKITNANYRSIRRIVSSWATVSHQDKQLAVTRLLQAYRARMPKAELRIFLEKLARTSKFELKDVANPETGQPAPETTKTTPASPEEKKIPSRAGHKIAKGN